MEPATPEVKKNSHWITILAMALFVLASLGAVAFLYYQNQTLKKMLASYQSQPSPSPTATSDPTLSWKTYTNPKLGVELKYPTEWAAPEEVSQSINFSGKLIIAKGPFYDQVLKRNLTLAEYEIRSYGDETPRYDFTLDGLIGKRGLEKAISHNSDLVVLAKDNKSTDITTVSYIYDPKKEGVKIFDQILSTFKFLDEKSGGSCQYNGKAYKSGEAVPSLDKCNTCSCENGQVACTLMACE